MKILVLNCGSSSIKYKLFDMTDKSVIASGGAGTLEHFYQAATEGKASALLAASVFHFGTFTVKQVKEYLASRGIPVKL